MKAYIMAGGKGTRMSTLFKDIPKAMAIIDGMPILEHQINVLKKQDIKDITLIVGFLSKVIEDYFKDGRLFGVNIKYIHEIEPLGTAGALYYAKEDIKEASLLIFGDIFFDINISKFMQYHNKKKANLTLLTHPNSHPYDSDIVVLKDDGEVIDWDSKNNIRIYDYDNNVNAGIYIITNKIFEYIKGPIKLDLEKDIISKMIINHDKVYGYMSSEYVKDAGTPDRYLLVQNEFSRGITRNKNLQQKQKCIFLDRDGTINIYKNFIIEPSAIELIEGVAEAIRLINKSEYLVIVITNQPVIARGDCTKEMLEKIHKRIKTLLGREHCYIDDIFYCPHHPDKGFIGEVKELKFDCDCRKPKIGLYLKAKEKYNIDFNQSYMIGDSDIDIKAGKNAGLKTIKVETNMPNILLQTIKKILKKNGEIF